MFEIYAIVDKYQQLITFFATVRNLMTTLATIILPIIVFGINTAFFETDNQGDTILRRTLKSNDEEYWRSEFHSKTKNRALVNMVSGFLCVILFSVFIQEMFLLLSSMTFFCHALWYLYLVWHKNDIYLKVLLRDEHGKKNFVSLQSQKFEELVNPAKTI